MSGFLCADRRGFAPPINGRCATPTYAPSRQPIRLQRPRARKNGPRIVTPKGATYVGRPTLWGNVFAERVGIGHARSVILFRAWLAGDLSRYVLRRAGFSHAEIDGLVRRRALLLEKLPALAGRDLQCWCPLTSEWCHADVLIDFANRRRALA